VRSIALLAIVNAIAGWGCIAREGVSSGSPTSATVRAIEPENLGIEWVRIRGSEPSAIKPFEISRHEITNAQYAAFVQATGYDGRDHPSSKSTEPFLASWRNREFPPPMVVHPVCYVNWHHARAFCDWLSRIRGEEVRLPTDAEWSLAARGPEARVYPWGNAWDPKRCNWGEGGSIDGFPESSPVGSFPQGATPEGVMDLAGNIWEWSAERHLRGGPWCLAPDMQRSEVIAEEDPERADDKFGFRVVREVSE